MINKKIRILNFDDSVTAQKGLLSHYEAEVVELRDLGSAARFWADAGTAREIESRLPASDSAVTFLGSGDFHHVTKMLLAMHEEPVSLIDFDLHHDWDVTSSLLHCGSWVSQAMGRHNVQKCIMIGAAAKEMHFFSLQAGDIDLLENDRLEIYPYASAPGIVFFKKVPENISYDIKRYPFFTKIYWNELKSKNLAEFFLHVIRRLPTKKVYVTIDKDCLKAEDALTNWDQGTMPLEGLLLMLKLIKENLDIVGMDITGDYSPISVDGIFKSAVSVVSHPKKIAAKGLSQSFITSVNENTNLKILDLITA